MKRLLPVLLLVGCAAAPPTRVAFDSAPSTTVTVPVIATCVEPGEIPGAAASAIPARGADVGRLAAGASADVRQLRLDNAKMRAMLLACASATPAK